MLTPSLKMQISGTISPFVRAKNRLHGIETKRIKFSSTTTTSNKTMKENSFYTMYSHVLQCLKKWSFGRSPWSTQSTPALVNKTN